MESFFEFKMLKDEKTGDKNVTFPGSVAFINGGIY